MSVPSESLPITFFLVSQNVFHLLTKASSSCLLSICSANAFFASGSRPSACMFVFNILKMESCQIISNQNINFIK